MSFEGIIQQAIFERLKNSSSITTANVGVYDEVPQAEDSVFPFIVIGDDHLLQWDTNTELGAEVTATIHTWSRFSGKSETKALQSIIYTALHRADVVVTDYTVVLCVWLNSTSFLDTDGITRHGVQTFKLLIEKN